jgi:hypothetical protein
MLVGGRYLLAEPVGEGGLGRVWRGHDQLLDRVVAVKEVLLPPQSSDEDADLVARTVREARAATRLDHPGAVPVYDVVEHDGAPWIVMRLISGPSLGAEIARLGRLPWLRAAEIGGQVAHTLAAAHAAGLVHGDLKPDNILLPGRQAIVTDFGIARITDAAAKRTSTGERAGTVHYLAPEQLEGGGAGPPADLWALGATLYAVTEGRPPFDGPATTATEAILTRAPAPAQHAGPLRELIEALLAKKPAERPDAQAVSNALAGAVDAITDEPAKEVFAASQRVQLAPGSGEATRPAPLSRRRLPRLALACWLFAAAAIGITLALVPLTGTPPSSEPVTAAPAATLGEPSGNAFGGLIEAMAFGPGGMLAEGDLSGNIFIWNTATRKITATFALPAHRRWVTSVAFGPSGTLAAGNAYGGTYLWDTTTRKLIATLHSPGEHRVNSVAWGPGGVLAVGHAPGATYLWDTTTRKLIATLHGPGDYFGVNSVAWGPDGTLATGDTNGSTYLWDTTTRKLIATLSAPGDIHEVGSVAWGPGGVLAAGDSADGGTYLWDTTTRKLIATLPDRYGVTSVAFGPGGMLAVGDPVDTWVWDTTTKRIATVLTAPYGTLTSVAFGPDATLAVSYAGGQICLWHLSP